MQALLFEVFFKHNAVATDQYSEPLVMIQEPLDDKFFCVRGARKYSYMNIPRQNADQFEHNSAPIVGGLVLLRYGSVSHVGVNTKVTNGGVQIIEWNYEAGKETERFIPYDDKALVGFWSEPIT